ncbi:phosphoribosyltransferase domain-containing protein [Sphingopyxis sp. RIFCSPHIGHO2_12_FULL_65_19]|uniref:phosphoribosyltransferase domain-containing protein n=1 Tax=Sphingopyxis sp. RIFCSPHIGHO2_12_FULL_65_19 TaxID=1802172 RepID=UPI0008C4383C|nr:phosphoribosyltransferase domain-containing protein [Sphingopyxis sp. RIFCSPHIGHO2_12_FULL_65_19]OHD09235.1 MAG: hypothetical protein A3E77_03290 [Sphingopyxis sp. RIFCSPHIGHO2_12_FULL_65_19]
MSYPMQFTRAAPAMTVDLSTGTLDLFVDGDADLEAFCDVAARANPRRGFLIVSRVLGRHLPARPGAMRAAMDGLAARVGSDLPGPVVFLGMAETATALGQGCFAAWQARHPGADAVYLQSSRQRVAGAEVAARFEEGHSHATSHLVQIADPAIRARVAEARALVIVDDECSTGATFVAAATALLGAMPRLERIETCCITDWSDGSYLDAMPRPAAARAIVSGRMRWSAATAAPPAELAAGSNAPGAAPDAGMKSRTGLLHPERARRAAVAAAPGERVLVLGEGEHSYEALLVAEEIERQGGIAAVQCITRSPALIGGAMASKSTFRDSYDSGAPCFLYNMLAHAPDRVVIVTERPADQRAEAAAALADLGSSVPVDVVACLYAGGEGE